MSQHPNFTAPEIANLLAGQAVAAATSYLEKRSDDSRLAHEAAHLFGELMRVGRDPRCTVITDVTRMLAQVMLHTAVTSGERSERWAALMAAFVPLLRSESTDLAKTGAQRQ